MNLTFRPKGIVISFEGKKALYAWIFPDEIAR